MENAVWIDWRASGPPSPEIEADRVYFGHETCERLLPPFPDALRLAAGCRRRGVAATLVTPFLTEGGLVRSRTLINELRRALPDLEIVCNDWGLLHWLGKEALASPVVGRLLSAQSSDPRISRMIEGGDRNHGRDERTVLHVDGSLCRVRRKPLSAALLLHYQSCWIDKEATIAFLQSLGVRRCEISNLPQGLSLAPVSGWSYSLHVPDALVSVMRNCPGRGEDLGASAPCESGACDPSNERWTHPGFPMDLLRRQNALYFRWDRLPHNLETLPVDRIVRRCESADPA